MGQSRRQLKIVVALAVGLIPVGLIVWGARRGPVWAILVAAIGVFLCGLLTRYRLSRCQYEEERNVLYVRLIAIYHVDD